MLSSLMPRVWQICSIEVWFAPIIGHGQGNLVLGPAPTMIKYCEIDPRKEVVLQKATHPEIPRGITRERIVHEVRFILDKLHKLV